MSSQRAGVLAPVAAGQKMTQSGVSDATLGQSLSEKVAILTGCKDRPYAFGLAMSLSKSGGQVEVIGSDSEDSPELHLSSNLKFLNLKQSSRGKNSRFGKALQVLVYYARLIRYVADTDTRILHILWNNRFEYFDRTLLMLYFKACGKRVVITAHNVNSARRDSIDSLLNRITLRTQYHLVDHIFVHTAKMKQELSEQFGILPHSVTVIRHPINDAFPDTALTPREARLRLNLDPTEQVLLFFGRIRPYKGLEYLLEAFDEVADADPRYRLIIAGECQKGYETYSRKIQLAIRTHRHHDRIISRIEFVPDSQAELYLKSADVLVLPYKEIFQSGVLFLAYSFGLPVIAADVGSFKEEIIEGETGFLCKPCDSGDLARAIRTYCGSDLFLQLNRRRPQIRQYALAQYSWHAVAQLTNRVYVSLEEK